MIMPCKICAKWVKRKFNKVTAINYLKKKKRGNKQVNRLSTAHFQCTHDSFVRPIAHCTFSVKLHFGPNNLKECWIKKKRDAHSLICERWRGEVWESFSPCLFSVRVYAVFNYSLVNFCARAVVRKFVNKRLCPPSKLIQSISNCHDRVYI